MPVDVWLARRRPISAFSGTRERTMSEASRRSFLRQVGGTSLACAMTSTVAHAAGATRTKIALIGTGGMGTYHIRRLAARDDVELAWLCDVDRKRVEAAGGVVQAAGKSAPRLTGDLRDVLRDDSVEAVFIATPDHWHAPAAILGLDAGKHVYVEKPCCHNIREGQLMAEAVKRSGKMLQVGTQSRSTGFVREAIERIRAGEIGEVMVAKAWNSQRRSSIGRSQPSTPPANLDFDTWQGPVPRTPFRSNMLHAIWRWWYDYGCGDIGNDGVHDIDVALWGLGVETHPDRVSCLGGKYAFDDDQQFPDTQYAIFEYDPEDGDSSIGTRQLIYEQRIWSPYPLEGYENGAAFYGTKGQLVMGHTSGWKMYGPRNKLVAEGRGRADLDAHHTNFLDCVRSGKPALNADIAVGHRAATIAHLANISQRLGRNLTFDPRTETFAEDTAANAMLARRYEPGHWSVPEGAGQRS